MYGEDHPEVAASTYNLAYDYREFGQHNDSKRMRRNGTADWKEDLR